MRRLPLIVEPMRVAGLLLLLGCGAVAPRTPDAGPAVDSALPDAGPASDAMMHAGPIAWYPMDTIANSTVADATSSHNGTCDGTGCPTVTAAGQIGSAYVFDGSDDLIRVRSTPVFENQQGFTVTAWFAFDAGTDSGCLVNKILGARLANSWQACLEDGFLRFYTATAIGNHAQSTAGTLAPGRYHHLALWSDGSAKALFVNGERVAHNTGVTILFDERPITIGADLDDGLIDFQFRGRIDDVRIYDRALSEAEITALQAP